ncbi:MAG: hypothetical protein HDR72_00795 [Ruminococcaceae bacterium]|nr:hypothetical protein [Oscillospiraceae bacterium]
MIRKATINSSTLSISDQCRCDAKYGIFVSQDLWNAFQYEGKLQTISELLVQIPIKKVCKGELSSDHYLINISDQTPRSGILNHNNINLVETLNSDKIILTDCDIFVSKLGMPRGYIYLNPKTKSELIGSSEFIPYKLKDISNKYFYLYLLLMPQIRHAYRCLETGKTPSHKRVNPAEFLKIKVPVFTKEKIKHTNMEIQKKLELISELESKKLNTQTIVDEVFSRYFSIDIDLRNKLHKGMTYGTQTSANTHSFLFNSSLAQISMNNEMRFSARFGNPFFTELEDKIKAYGYITINELIVEKIHRGKTPKYNSNGEIPVVKTAHLKNGEIIISTDEFVTETFYHSQPSAHVVKGDILIASTGKSSLGNVDSTEHHIDMYADSHITILRINEKKCLKKFLVYFLWSVLGCYQFEKGYTGSTNQIEISHDQIGDILIPDISISSQQEIIKEIQDKINIQAKITSQILELRDEIDKTILNAIATL